jgi:hypothetical protein
MVSEQFDNAAAENVRRRTRPHIPVRCVVELVRADATKGAGDPMTTPSGPQDVRPDPGLSVIMNERRPLISLAPATP